MPTSDGLQPPRHLLKVWHFIRWLDLARWQGGGYGFIPGPVFTSLDPGAKILTHWLAYVMDQQRPYQEVWEQGGPVLAELVLAYSNGKTPTLETLRRFAEPGDGVDHFLTRRQRGDGAPIEFTPRYGMHLVSLAGTLGVLEGYERSLLGFLAGRWSFVREATNRGDDDLVHRIAFLLYALTYRDVKKGLTSVHDQSLEKFVERRTRRLTASLASPRGLEKEYRDWLNSGDRYLKRPWAALRDYVKPGSPYKELLLQGFESIGRADIAKTMRSQETSILRGLEVPGDVWDLRFFERVFGHGIKPASLRGWYETLQSRGALPEGSYVEQFDVSFDYSPYMCEERGYETCVFRQGSRIKSLCPPHKGVEWREQACPVVAYLCGYEYPCNPTGCPVREQEAENLCQGCELRIELKTKGGSG